MNKKLILLALPLLALGLASCSSTPSSSASSEVQTNWTSEDLYIFETYLGENNVIPFFSLFPILEYEVYYETTCDYVVVVANGDNTDYINQYATICSENGFTLDASSQNETFARLSKTLVDDTTKTSIQYVDIYISVGMFTVDTFISTTYYSTSWPTSPSVESLIDLETSVVSYDEDDIVSLSYTSYTLNYTPKCEINIVTTNPNANDVYVSSLISNDYELDFNETTAYDYLYYCIGEIIEDDEPIPYVVEAQVSKQCTQVDNGYQFTIVLWCSYAY